MKKVISLLLVGIMLLSCLIAGLPAVSAAKAGQTRAIAIVFDNSGSMYVSGDQAWCRATYAMEVFASMLNKGDVLLIYPMHPITVGGTEYTMESPFRVTDSSQAATIREIFTPKAVGTPIESIDCAVEGLKSITADKKYMIVLTDGEAFYQNNYEMSAEETRSQLDRRFEEQAGKTMNVMYLGIGDNVVMPGTAQSEFFVKNQAKNSKDVLSALTAMCNQIFGRDSLPKSYISGNKVSFDISMSKLIVFVQGENVSNLKLSNGSGEPGELVGSTATKYGTTGCGNYDSVPDTSLQGMMVTYTGCAAGTYDIQYSGTATSIEVYYEPDADLDFVFTDSAGNTVDYNALYEGDYKVSFGMKDARTGKLIVSELLGDPQYNGSYSINDTTYEIKHDGQSGEVPVKLNMNDTFKAELTVTYLNGYTISKDSSDFGWPDIGIKVAARPAGALVLEITGGDSEYPLQSLEAGSAYTAKVYYEGVQLTGDALKSVPLEWDPDVSSVELKKEFAEDHYKIALHHKDPESPKSTACGEYTVPIYASYTAQGSDKATTSANLTYTVTEDVSTIKVDLTVPEDYLVISKLDESREITANLTLNGKKLTPEQFASATLNVDCGGIDYKLTPNEKDSSYKIKLRKTEDLTDGEYSIKATADYTDLVGRVTGAEAESSVTLSKWPLWVKWAIGLLLLLLLIIIIMIILHIKVLPTKAHVTKKDSSMIFDGEDETKSTAFDCKIKKKQMSLSSKYAGVKTGLSMDVTPGKESYLRKSQKRRSADVRSTSVRKFGNAVIQEASIGSIRYALNEDTNKLERVPPSDKPFPLKHGTRITYSGTMMNAGVQKPFTVNTKLNFKKK